MRALPRVGGPRCVQIAHVTGLVTFRSSCSFTASSRFSWIFGLTASIQSLVSSCSPHSVEWGGADRAAYRQIVMNRESHSTEHGSRGCAEISPSVGVARDFELVVRWSVGVASPSVSASPALAPSHRHRFARRHSRSPTRIS